MQNKISGNKKTSVWDTEGSTPLVLLECGNVTSQERVKYHSEYAMYRQVKVWLAENLVDDSYVRIIKIDGFVEYEFEKSELAVLFKLRFEPQEGPYKSYMAIMIDRMIEAMQMEIDNEIVNLIDKKK